MSHNALPFPLFIIAEVFFAIYPVYHGEYHANVPAVAQKKLQACQELLKETRQWGKTKNDF